MVVPARRVGKDFRAHAMESGNQVILFRAHTGNNNRKRKISVSVSHATVEQFHTKLEALMQVEVEGLYKRDRFKDKRNHHAGDC